MLPSVLFPIGDFAAAQSTLPIPNAATVVALEIGGCNFCVIGLQPAWVHQESEDAIFLPKMFFGLMVLPVTTCVIS